MTKSALLKSIAQCGYNLGFGAKRHFVTYDTHRILPKLISVIVLFIGAFQLTEIFKKHISPEGSDILSVALIFLALIAISVDFLSKNIERYNVVGKQLLTLFNELREMYNRVSEMPDSSDFTSDNQRLKEIESSLCENAISEQAIFTHIITNMRFFSEMQVSWIDEQLHFKAKDKFPFFHPEAIILYILVVAIVYFIIKQQFC